MSFTSTDQQWTSSDQQWSPSSEPVVIEIPLRQIVMESLVPTRPYYKVAGAIIEAGSPAARTVRVHNRSTGALVTSKVSDSEDGSFEITYVPNESLYIVALDNDTGDDYNALIYDRVLPVEEVS